MKEASGEGAAHTSLSARVTVRSGGGATDEDREAGVERHVTFVRETVPKAGLGRRICKGVALKLPEFVRSPKGEDGGLASAFARTVIHVSGIGGTGGTG